MTWRPGPRTVTLTLTEKQVESLLRQIEYEPEVRTEHSPTVPREQVEQTPAIGDDEPIEI